MVIVGIYKKRQKGEEFDGSPNSLKPLQIDIKGIKQLSLYILDHIQLNRNAALCFKLRDVLGR